MYLGIEIGGTKLQCVVGESNGAIRARERHAVDRAAGSEGIRRILSEAVPRLVRQWGPSGVGVGFGGPVDWKTGQVCCSHQIAGWGDFPLGEWLSSLSGLRVAVENDANVAALGEATHGAGKGYDPVFWINMGSGVGGGLVVGGRLYHGAKPGEAEVGHLRLDRSGVLLEDRCSGWAVDRRIREAIAGLSHGVLVELCGQSPGAEARHLSAALKLGDPIAEKILREVADDLAFALGHVTQLFHPSLIVVGGGLSLVGEPLRAAMAAALPKYVMDSFQPGPKVALAGLGEDSVPVGALCLIHRALSGDV